MSGQESSLFDEIFILLQLVDGKHSLQFVMIGTLCFILGRVALVAQRTSRQTFPSTICRSVGPYARKCFGRSVCPVHCGKTADRIRMPFGVIGRKGPGIRQVVGFWDRSMGRGTVGANLRRAIVTNGDFTAYVSDCAATRPSSQITLGKLVIFLYALGCVALNKNYATFLARDAFVERVIALLPWCSSVCLSGTGVHCDHTVHVGADLSLLLDSPMFWAAWQQCTSTYSQASFFSLTWNRGGVWMNTRGTVYTNTDK